MAREQWSGRKRWGELGRSGLRKSEGEKVRERVRNGGVEVKTEGDIYDPCVILSLCQRTH